MGIVSTTSCPDFLNNHGPTSMYRGLQGRVPRRQVHRYPIGCWNHSSVLLQFPPISANSLLFPPDSSSFPLPEFAPNFFKDSPALAPIVSHLPLPPVSSHFLKFSPTSSSFLLSILFTMPQPSNQTLNALVEELIKASEVIENRPGLNLAQETRVTEAFSLLVAGLPQGQSKAIANRREYHEFLVRVEKNLGRKGIVLCAAASRVASMKEALRINLPAAVKEREAEMKDKELQKLGERFCES